MFDVRNWLLENGFERFADLFEENEIDGEVLFDLTDDDLKDLGLALGPRKKLLKAIAVGIDSLNSQSGCINHFTFCPEIYGALGCSARGRAPAVDRHVL